MKMVKCLDQHTLLEKGLDALYKELGPVEARRFMALTHRTALKDDSVKRHRRYQQNLEKNDFLARIRAAHENTQKK